MLREQGVSQNMVELTIHVFVCFGGLFIGAVLMPSGFHQSANPNVKAVIDFS